MNLKVNYNKVLWKELFIGIIEGFLWCSIIFLAVYGFCDEIIELLQFMTDNVDKVWPIYFSVLPIFIVIAMVLKLGAFILKFDGHAEKKTRTAAPKATKKTTTVAKKKTTKK